MITINEIIIEFNKIIAVAQNKSIFARGIEIQKEEIEFLEKYKNKLSLIKSSFVENELEYESNLIFCFEESVRTIQLELTMIVNLKEDKMDIAWDNLVDAQVSASTVVSNHPNGQDLEGYLDKLRSYEIILFPKMMFASIGGIVKKSECSICNDSYGKCNHIKGKLYMGEMCCRVITQMVAEEFSIVENPANKHCRVLTLNTDESGEVDVLTLRKIIN
jgi:hypothetical protein